MKLTRNTKDTLNSAQLEFLDNFIGPRGFGFLAIKDYVGNIDFGTRVLYLERAINEDCMPFLKLLDKLYQPVLAENEVLEHITLMGMLKNINDLCFNNEVLSANKETGRAQNVLTALGEVNSDAIQTQVQTLIRARLLELKAVSPTIPQEIEARLRAEVNSSKNSCWRSVFHLPLSQLDPYAPVSDNTDTPYLQDLLKRAKPGSKQTWLLSALLGTTQGTKKMAQNRSDSAEDQADKLHGFINEAQCKLLEPAIRRFVLDNVDEVVDLGLCGATVEQVKRMTLPLLRVLVNNMHGLKRFVFIMKIPFARIMALNIVDLEHALKYSLELNPLITFGELSPEKYLSFDENTRYFVRTHRIPVIQYQRALQVSCSEIVSLSEQMREFVVAHHEKLINFLRTSNIPFNEVRALNVTQWQHVLGKSTIDAMQAAFLDERETLNEKREFVDVTHHLAALAKEMGVPLETIKHHFDSITKLTSRLGVTPMEFNAIDKSAQKLMLDHSNAFIQLVNGDESVSFKQLAKLGLSQLKSLIRVPLSTEAEELLASLQLENRIDVKVATFFQTHAHAVIILTVNLKIPFSAILDLDEDRRTLVLTQHASIKQLFNGDDPVNFDQLSRLEYKDLHTVLTAPTSPEAKDIIQSLRSAYEFKG